MRNVLCLIHQTPPVHGAAVVGDQVLQLIKADKSLHLDKLSLSGGLSISDLGGISFSKLLFTLKLILKTIFFSLSKKYSIVYFTPSLGGFAFYRDLLLLAILKFSGLFYSKRILLHIHMRPSSLSKKYISNMFFSFAKNCEIILLSKLLEKDFDHNKLFRNKVHIIPNGIKPININETKLNELVIQRKSGKRIILYIGHLISSKGYQRALDIACMYKENTSVEFHFAGEFGSLQDENYFNKFITKNNLTNISYLGVLREKNKIDAFINSSLLILPSYSEALPLTLLEAMSVGLPIVASPVGAIPEILSDTISQTSETEKDFYNSINHVLQNYDLQSAEQILLKYEMQYSESIFDKSFKELLKNH